jgi:hypothetical protein
LVLDCAFEPGRKLLEERAAELLEPPAAEVDALVALDGLHDPQRREEALEEAERRVASGARVLIALDSQTGSREAQRFPGAVVLDDDSEALIIAAGFEDGELSGATVSTQIAASPALRAYITSLERANAELLRANRELMRERIGSAGSAAASIADVRGRADEATARAKEMEDFARDREEMVRRVQAWYDAPRYHLVDRIRDVLRRIPLFRPAIRFLWSLLSTRPENPRLELPPEEPERDSEAQPELPGEGEHDRLEG